MNCVALAYSENCAVCPDRNCDGQIIDIGEKKGVQMYMCDMCGKKFTEDQLKNSGSK